MSIFSKAVAIELAKHDRHYVALAIGNDEPTLQPLVWRANVEAGILELRSETRPYVVAWRMVSKLVMVGPVARDCTPLPTP